jgi:hypothetical protein
VLGFLPLNKPFNGCFNVDGWGTKTALFFLTHQMFWKKQTRENCSMWLMTQTASIKKS